MDNEHLNICFHFNVMTWNFSFLTMILEMQRDVQDALCSYHTSTAGVSRCFFRHFPTARYTACLAQHCFKAYRELSATLINVSAPPLPQTGGYGLSPGLHIPHLPSFLLRFSGNPLLLICHLLYLPFLFPNSQFYPFPTHKHEKQSSCSSKKMVQRSKPLQNATVIGKESLLSSHIMF